MASKKCSVKNCNLYKHSSLGRLKEMCLKHLRMERNGLPLKKKTDLIDFKEKILHLLRSGDYCSVRGLSLKSGISYRDCLLLLDLLQLKGMVKRTVLGKKSYWVSLGVF